MPPTSSLYPLEEILKLKSEKPSVLPVDQDLLFFDSPPPYIQPPPQNPPQRLEQELMPSALLAPSPDSTGMEEDAPAPSPPSSCMHLH